MVADVIAVIEEKKGMTAIEQAILDAVSDAARETDNGEFSTEIEIDDMIVLVEGHAEVCGYSENETGAYIITDAYVSIANVEAHREDEEVNLVCDWGLIEKKAENILDGRFRRFTNLAEISPA